MNGKLDLETLTRLIEQGEILDNHGAPAPHAPRNILKQQLARLAERGWTAYMAFAATLAAGLHGIGNELELPEAFVGNMYAAKRVPDVPKTLREALAAFEKSKVLRAAFGDPVVDHYLHAGNWEQAEYDRRITDWELIRYFERA